MKLTNTNLPVQVASLIQQPEEFLLDQGDKEKKDHRE